MWHQTTGGHSNLQHGGNGERSSENKDNRKEMVEHTEKKHQQQPQQKQCLEKKWVQSLTNSALTEAEEMVLVHGPNFEVVTNEPPTGESIAHIERVRLKMKQGRWKS